MDIAAEFMAATINAFEANKRLPERCTVPTTRNPGILRFEDVDVLDLYEPFEVFSVANRFADSPAFKVLTVAEKR